LRLRYEFGENRARHFRQACHFYKMFDDMPMFGPAETSNVRNEGSGFRGDRVIRYIALRRAVAILCCVAVLNGITPAPLLAQAPPAAEQAGAQDFSVEQLDALVAPIALYPDELLTQILMASAYPLQVVEAARWLDVPANKSLSGDALTAALAKLNWDPSVKSLVPFPQVLAMMNGQLDWMQQLGYAMTVQQNAVMDSVQRLRRQAQGAGHLQTTAQQVVQTEGETVVIAPAQPNVVYVPSYNPTVVYGAWPYPSYPPVYLPPPPGHAFGTALATGLAFGAGVAITAGLWGWARPNWGGGNVNVNVNRYNSINANRTQIRNSTWRPTTARPAGAGLRPPGGPVGAPARRNGLPANGVGRPSASVPGGVVRPPSGMGPGNRPPINQSAATRSAAGQGAGQARRPTGGQAAGQRARPTGQRPVGQAGNRAPGAFSGVSDGRNAAQFGNRGAQSRQLHAPQRSGGGGGARAGGGRR
jgi:hypothetical protein